MRLEEEPEVKPIFGYYKAHSGEPALNLLDQILRSLPPEQQIAQITDCIAASWQNHKAPELVDGLRKVMVDGVTEGQWPQYRATLMELYGRLPGTGIVDSYWNDSEQRNYQIPIKGEVAPELKLKLLEEVLGGWRMVSIRAEEGSFRHVDVPGPDANDCYQFVCGIYKKADQQGRIQKGLIPVLRNHLETESGHGLFKYDQLDSWIFDKVTPSEFAAEMLQYQIRHGGAQRVLDGIRASSRIRRPVSA